VVHTDGVHEGHRYIDLLAGEWAVIDELCSSLTDEQWDLPTDLPGWSVKDNLSHIVGIECILLGRTAPHTMTFPDYVRNGLGELNEIEVDYRRPNPGRKVLEEFRSVTAERLEVLRAATDDDLEQQSWTPIGIDTVATLIAIRVLDCWAHEQDIRRAVGMRGHLDGPIAEHALAMISRALPKVIAKRARAPDGSVVVVHVDGATLAVTVEGGRGRRVEGAFPPANVEVAMDLETYMCLACGRWNPSATIGAGSVTIEGDRELGERVLLNFNAMV
jgi:uncharacterized protein (TIGR03083 family)